MLVERCGHPLPDLLGVRLACLLTQEDVQNIRSAPPITPRPSLSALCRTRPPGPVGRHHYPKGLPGRQMESRKDSILIAIRHQFEYNSS